MHQLSQAGFALLMPDITEAPTRPMGKYTRTVNEIHWELQRLNIRVSELQKQLQNKVERQLLLTS